MLYNLLSNRTLQFIFVISLPLTLLTAGCKSIFVLITPPSINSEKSYIFSLIYTGLNYPVEDLASIWYFACLTVFILVFCSLVKLHAGSIFFKKTLGLQHYLLNTIFSLIIGIFFVQYHMVELSWVNVLCEVISLELITFIHIFIYFDIFGLFYKTTEFMRDILWGSNVHIPDNGGFPGGGPSGGGPNPGHNPQPITNHSSGEERQRYGRRSFRQQLIDSNSVSRVEVPRNRRYLLNSPAGSLEFMNGSIVSVFPELPPARYSISGRELLNPDPNFDPRLYSRQRNLGVLLYQLRLTGRDTVFSSMLSRDDLAILLEAKRRTGENTNGNAIHITDALLEHLGGS